MYTVQAKIKENHHYGIYNHCMAHKLNLVVVEGVKVKNTQFLVSTYYNKFIFFSVCLNSIEYIRNAIRSFSQPSNCSKLILIQSQLRLRKGNVLRICDTRWVCRFKNCDLMINNYPAILKFLINEVEDQHYKDAVEVKY